MANQLVDDELREVIAPVLPMPKRRRRRYPGRKPLDNRRVLSGILFVLRSSIPREVLPQEMGCGSGMSCLRRLRAWQKARVWDRLHRTLLSKLCGADKLELSRVVVDSSSVRAVHGGKNPDPTQQTGARPVACATSARWARHPAQCHPDQSQPQ